MSAPNVPQTPEEWDAWEAEIRRSLEEQDRDAILTRMGCQGYEEYLGSSFWRKIKKRILAKYDRKCVRCGGHASEVHHRSYTEAVLKGEDDEQLRPLCSGCHDVVEYDDDRLWRSPSEKERVLFETNIRRDYPRPLLDTKRKKVKVLNPPKFRRMNWLQREAWQNEFRWLAFTAKSPDLAVKEPDAYARLKAAYESTKEHGIDPPTDLRPPKGRRSRRSPTAGK